MSAALTDELAAERVGVSGKLTVDDILKAQPRFVSLGGQFLLDPNEFNAWGVLGPFDNTNSQDLGNVGAGVSRIAGGFCFPFDVQLQRMFAWHQNNNAGALAWGWRLARQTKTNGNNAVTNIDLLRECTGTGATASAPRNYLNTTTQQTDISLAATPIIPSGDVIVLGVESPTAVTTNRYVRIMSGYIEYVRV